MVGSEGKDQEHERESEGGGFGGQTAGHGGETRIGNFGVFGGWGGFLIIRRISPKSIDSGSERITMARERRKNRACRFHFGP